MTKTQKGSYVSEVLSRASATQANSMNLCTKPN